MKILIHTLFYDNYNYGGILQAYALYHTLEGQGDECMELNYERGGAKSEWLIRRCRNVAQMISRPVAFKEKYNSIKQDSERTEQYHKLYSNNPIKRKLDAFMSENFRQTKLYNSATISGMTERYDVCITGGDQMWNPLWNDVNYYLHFSNKRNIAYSCSAGKDEITQKDEKVIMDGLRCLQEISVREKQLYEWLQDRKIKACRVCDPVFLLTDNAWKEFAVNDLVAPRDYIFAYLLGDGKEIRTAVRTLANRLGLKLVLIPHVKRKYNPYDEKLADYAPMEVGPREFVGYIKNAKYVVTDSFHGSAFSILLQKPFVSVSRFAEGDKNALNSRILTLLDIYDLQDRMVSVNQVSSLSEFKLGRINWNDILETKKTERKLGIQFLENSLKDGE